MPNCSAMSSRAIKRRKGKANSKSDSAVKKSYSKEINPKEDETNDANKPSLPVLSNEKISNDDFLIRTRFQKNTGDRKQDILVPKFKIRCEALDIEKIVDFKNNKVVINRINKIKKPPVKIPEKSSRRVNTAPKVACNKKIINLDKNSSAVKCKKKKSYSSSRKKVKKIIKDDNAKKPPVPSVDSAEKKEKVEIYPNKEQQTFNEKSDSCIQSTNIKQLSLQVNTSENFMDLSSENLNDTTLNIQRISCCSSLTNMHDGSVFLQLSEINLEELEQPIKSISDEELKMKEMESKYNENGVFESNILMNSEGFTALSDKNQSVLDQVNYLKKTSLQVAVEAFMKNPQLNYLKENTALKKGLCFTWLSNNYMCFNQQCPYSHNALNLFTKKLKQYPSKFIMTVVVSMRNDILFVDVIMAAFKVLSERQIPMVWVTFLIYFVFYVTEPSDSRFLKFWANSARFFCQSDENYAAAKGFASLLSIFSQGDTSEEWKIVEFIKLIKQPPVQIHVNYALLQPVLKMNLPTQFLTEAIESSIATQKDVLKVQSVIIPKISIMTSPIKVVELLLEFSKTLEKLNYNSYADDLKQQLQTKVLTFKTKITQKEYPLTASFQEEINVGLKEGSCVATCESFPEEFLNILESSDFENNYFKPGDDFCDLVTEAMGLSFDFIPSPCRNGRRSDVFMKEYDINNNNSSITKISENGNREEDVCERQVTRIQQFFRDCQFDSLAKYLNELRPNVIERAAEEFLKLSLKMKISLQQVVDLVKIIVLPCKSENAAKVIASISITFILNLVRINEWEKAYGIASICQKKQINLVEGKVFYFIEFNPVTQCRIALLLIEIYAHKNDYASALDLVKKYNLFSSNNYFWNLTGREQDEIIRVRILEDLLQQIISNQSEWAFTLFELIWKEQSQLLGPINLQKFVSDILILLLNQDSENAINVYEKIKAEVQLNETATRAILVTLVRHNRLSSVKNLLLSVDQNVYFFPEIILDSVTLKVSSFWLEEEIYAVFDAFFDLLAFKKQNFLIRDHKNLEIQIRILRPHNSRSCSVLRPLCLGIIKPFFKDACKRIQRVLSYQFNPPLKLIIMPYSLKLDECSVQRHLQKRMSRN